MGRRFGALLLAGGLAVSGPAQAAARWVGAPELDRARVALSLSRRQTTLWLSFGVHGNGQPGAIVVPMAPGSSIDPVSDAWFRALDEATAPRVVPPAGQAAPECGGSGVAVDDTREVARDESLPVVAVATFSTLAEVTDHAAALGFGLRSTDLEALGTVGPGAHFAVVTFDPVATETPTQTLRIRQPVLDPTLWVGIARQGTAYSVPLTLYGLGPGRAVLDHIEAIDAAELGTVFLAATGASDYRDRVAARIEAEQGAAALLECAGTGPLYRWTVLPDRAGAIQPLVRAYLRGAASLGDTLSDPDECLRQVWRLRDDDQPVSEICAGGTLVTGTCPETSDGEAADARRLFCGGADEIAYALSGWRPDQVVVTRLRLGLAAATPDRLGMSFREASESPATIRAATLDLTGCVVPGPAGGGRPLPEDDPAESEPDEAYVESPATDDGQTEIYVEADAESDCAGDTEPAPDTASSDCSGDSSSSGEPETCAGDSSSQDDAACSGDSGAGDGDTCSGDGGGSVEGDTCAGGSNGDCSVAHARVPRPRLSVLAVAWAALALPMRRRYRRRSSQARVSR